MEDRSRDQKQQLGDAVSSLWGKPQAQAAPQLVFFPEGEMGQRVVFPIDRNTQEPTVFLDGEVLPVVTAADGSKHVLRQQGPRGIPVSLSASHIDVDLHSDPRRKGLVWYALYDVGFHGGYKYEHRDLRRGTLRIRFALPSSTALYDDLSFEVDGKDQRDALDPTSGTLEVVVPVEQGKTIPFAARYRSRGSDDWSYRPAEGVQKLENFVLNMKTDFSAIDFPQGTLSPTRRTGRGAGHELSWLFQTTVTGQGIGMVLPQRLQPGELAADLAFSAPVSLLFFFVVLFVLATLRGLDIHPINYLFISAGFFSFHLLFAYSVDHLSVPWAFAICSAVSMFLVVTYLRLVVSTKFALREAAFAQFIYLILFSLAHFWVGFTGLTITLMAIGTLFVLMQAPGRIRWSESFARPGQQHATVNDVVNVVGPG